jgi:hypothetical protein
VSRHFRAAGAAALALLLAACSRTAPLALEELSAPGSGGAAGDAALAREPGSGALLLAWVAGDSGRRHVWFSRSTEAGAAWSAPVRVTRAADDVGPPHGESSPRVVAGGDGRVALVWSRSVPVPGRRFPASLIRFARSLDGGATWSEPMTLNDDSTSAPGTHTFHGAVWLGDSGIAAAWLDERGAADFPGHHHAPGDSTAPASGDARIFLTTSSDFGSSWTPDRAVWGSVCPCCRVTLARAPGGAVVAAWRQHFPGSVRDIVSATLLPVASAPARVHRDDWEYPGCPHTGPALAVDEVEAGARHIAWYTGKPGGAGIYYGRVPRGADAAPRAVALVSGASLQTGHPGIAPLEGGGVLVALDVDETGSRVIRVVQIGPDGSIVAAGTVPGSDGGTYPQVAALEGGGALVAWRQPEGESSRVRLVRVGGRGD